MVLNWISVKKKAKKTHPMQAMKQVLRANERMRKWGTDGVSVEVGYWDNDANRKCLY